MSLPKCTPLALNRKMFAENRKRLAQALGSPANGTFAVYKGGSEVPRYSSDTSYSFRQDGYFFHLFGCEQQDCLGAVNLSNGEGVVFIPRLPDEYAVWMGRLPTPESVKAELEIEHVYFTDEVAPVLERLGCKRVQLLKGTNTDSGHDVATATFDGIDKFEKVDDKSLFLTHTELRTIKTDLECEYFGKLNKVASAAHVFVMQTTKPGNYENHIEAAFTAYVMAAAQCRALAYGGIAASGPMPAILHYVDNNRQMNDGELALVDLGGELHCFASDITTTFPVNGKYTPVQAAVYTGVLEAHDAVVAALKPGQSWIDLHLLALRTIARTLRDKLGILRGTDEEIEKSEVMAAFMPHGLGHLIGLEVHDVGGYVEGAPPRGTTPLTKRCRTARVMKEGMLMTIEPGCYFNAVTLEAALKDPRQAPLLDEAKLRQPEFWNFGGIRIESNVKVTADGCLNYTDVPRTVEDVEAVMAGAPWPRK